MKITAVYFEITNRCNLDCTTCYNRSGLNQDTMEITKNRLDAAIKTLSQKGMGRVILSGGEPTLHTQFHEILSLVDKYPDILFGVVTNGTNHDAKLIDILNTRNNITLQISLDGSSEKLNAKTRGKANFEKAVAFAKQIHNPNAKPLLKMVISQHNYEDIEHFYALAISLDCIPEFAFIYKSGNGSDGWEDKCLTPEQKLQALNRIEMFNHLYQTEAALPLCTSGCPFTGDMEDLFIAVKPDGSIQPCQTLYAQDYCIGTLFDINEAAMEKNLEIIAALAKKRLETDYGCQRCILRGSCRKGCMAMAVCLDGDPLASDGECQSRRLQFVGYDLKKAMHITL